MPEGLGYGIGRGLEQIGESLNRRFQGQAADREKQADAYELQAKDIAANIAKIGGKDKPEAAPLIQQLQAVVTKHNALYPPHETPALLARIQKFIGKTPGAAKPDPRAGMTAEGSIAQAPVQPNAILDDMTNFISAAQSANPTMTREQAQQEWWKQMQVKGGTVAKAELRQGGGTAIVLCSVTATGGGGDITLNSVVISAGQQVSITSLTYTAPL